MIRESYIWVVVLEYLSVWRRGGKEVKIVGGGVYFVKYFFMINKFCYGDII